MKWEVRSVENNRWWCSSGQGPQTSYPPDTYALASEGEAKMWCEILNANPKRIRKLQEEYRETVRRDSWQCEG
jgi:hypothetical protein